MDERDIPLRARRGHGGFQDGRPHDDAKPPQAPDMDGDEIVAVNVQSGGRDAVQAVLPPGGAAWDGARPSDHGAVDERLVRVVDDSKVKPEVKAYQAGRNAELATIPAEDIIVRHHSCKTAVGKPGFAPCHFFTPVKGEAAVRLEQAPGGFGNRFIETTLPPARRLDAADVLPVVRQEIPRLPCNQGERHGHAR